MYNALLFVAIMLSTLAPSYAAIMPLPERNLSHEAILERLVDAQNTLKSWNIAGTKTRLEKLATELAGDTDAFNMAVRKKTQEIIGQIDSSHLRDVETKLDTLVQNVRDGVMPSFADLGDSAAM